jgi:large subunit ribosomal protein L18
MSTSVIEKKKQKWRARRTRTRAAIGRTDRILLTVYRSGRHIYAQLVDPATGATVGAVSSRTKGLVDGKTGNVEAAKRVGTAVAEVARSKNIDEVVFNRNGFLYHGRVRALAEAAREAGLRF